MQFSCKENETRDEFPLVRMCLWTGFASALTMLQIKSGMQMIDDLDPRSGTGPRSPILSDALDRGFSYLQSIQAPDGGWAVDYDGPLFLLPGYVFAHYVTGSPLSEFDRTAFIATVRRAQNVDGSFGFHLDGRGYQFTTVLNYVALRLMGVPADDADAKRAREWFLPAEALPPFPHGESIGCPYSISIPGMDVTRFRPSCGFFRRVLPIHPSRFWCQCRLIVLVVSYLVWTPIPGSDRPDPHRAPRRVVHGAV